MKISYKRKINDGFDEIDISKLSFDNNKMTGQVSHSVSWTVVNVPIISKWIHLASGYSSSYVDAQAKINYQDSGKSSPECLKAYISVPINSVGILWNELLPSILEHGFTMKCATEHLGKYVENKEHSQYGKTFVIYLGQENQYTLDEWQSFFNHIQNIIEENNLPLLGDIKNVYKFEGSDYLFCRRERGEDGQHSYNHSELPENCIFRQIEIQSSLKYKRY